MTKARVKVTPGPNEPVAVEIIEQSIIDLSAGMKKLNATRLTRETIVLLLHSVSGVGKPAIRKVLYNMGELENLFLKPLPKPKE